MMSSNYPRILLDIKVDNFNERNDNFENSKEINWEIIKIIYKVIEHDFPHLIESEFRVPIKASILFIREGSILATAAIIIETYSAVRPFLEDVNNVNGLIDFAKRMREMCQYMLDNAFRHSKIKINEKPKVEISEISSTNPYSNERNCEFYKINYELSECAKILEANLKNSGARLGNDYSKLDCFKLALEIMKYCQTCESH